MCCASLLFIVVVVTTTESVNVITNFVQYILCYIIRYYSSNTSAHITHTRFAHIAQDHPYEHTHLNPHKTIHTRGMQYISINNIQESCNAQGQKECLKRVILIIDIPFYFTSTLQSNKMVTKTDGILLIRKAKEQKQVS